MKRCVYCGGDAHPAECGSEDDLTPTPWGGYFIAAVIAVSTVIAVLQSVA